MSDCNPFVGLQPETDLELPASERFPRAGHWWSRPEIDALIFATAARRPLLVRGEAGSGKSQIARAAARVLGSGPPLVEVIHARFEALDLLYRVDTLQRLADAQLKKLDRTNVKYVKPGCLWQAMDRIDQEGTTPVVLIDEIDKADAEVPNGLLEALGATRFTPFGWHEPVCATGPAPLVVITTNNERALPDAFVRRCVTHELTLPPADEDEAKAAGLIDHLVGRGRAHFPQVDGSVLSKAASMLNADRHAADRNRWRPRPGQAEYLDLIRAVVTGSVDVADDEARTAAQLDRLETLRPFFLRKHVGAIR